MFFHNSISSSIFPKQKFYKCRGWIVWNFFSFDPCIGIFLGRTFRKVLLLCFLSKVELIIFQKNKCPLIFEDLCQKLHICKGQFVWNSFSLSLCLSTLIVKNFQNCCYYWFLSVIEFISISHYRFDIFHQDFNRKHYYFGRGLDLKKFLELCVRLQIARKKEFQIVFITLVHLFNKKTLHMNIIVKSFTQASIENFKLIEDGFLEISLCWQINQNTDWQKKPIFLNLKFYLHNQTQLSSKKWFRTLPSDS